VLLETKLKSLRTNYADVVGKPFNHFFCPLLLRDDQTELCKAHLLNQAFTDVSDKWTVQRRDVDNFYGGYFEGAFVALARESLLADYIGGTSPSSGTRPALHRNGQKIDHYFNKGNISPVHSQVLLQQGAEFRNLVVKIPPSEMVSTDRQDWEFILEKDCRLEALVSVLKAAHLIMFEMVGYGYALSAGGLFLGKTVLGDFFEQNRNLPKAEVLGNARAHFEQFANLVRPVLPHANTVGDTVSDRVLFVCEPGAWAVMVTMRTARRMHAAIVPTFTSPEGAAHFFRFLGGSGGTLRAKMCYFDGHVFQASRTTEDLIWPNANFA
jgi:hypothetical protein